jgi:hypothetical protein
MDEVASFTSTPVSLGDIAMTVVLMSGLLQ